MRFSQQISPPTRPRSRLDRREALAVAEAPDHPLVIRRHQLAMPQRKLAVGREDEQRVVERSAAALVDADGEDDPVLARDRADPLGVGARDGDRRLRKPRPELLSALAPHRERRAPSGTTGTRGRTSRGRGRDARRRRPPLPRRPRACRASRRGRRSPARPARRRREPARSFSPQRRLRRRPRSRRR